MTYKNGVLFALGAAVVSGISIYVNKFAVGLFSDPFLYATLKNTMVATGLLVAAAGWVARDEFRKLTLQQWTAWFALGLIGGGIPFLLFFQGLATASAPSASLIQKTLFLWVAVLAMPLLGERLKAWQGLGLIAVAGGEFLLQAPARIGWGSGEMLVLMATLLWAVETVLARHVLQGMSARVGALGRMGVGAVVMWGFLLITGRAGSVILLNGTQWVWVAITGVFLLAYTWIWYSALKSAPATLVTTVLVFGLVITLSLTNVLEGRPLSVGDLLGSVLIVIGLIAFVVPPIRRRIASLEAS